VRSVVVCCGVVRVPVVLISVAEHTYDVFFSTNVHYKIPKHVIY
jgi:hypothetical protein